MVTVERDRCWQRVHAIAPSVLESLSVALIKFCSTVQLDNATLRSFQRRGASCISTGGTATLDIGKPGSTAL